KEKILDHAAGKLQPVVAHQAANDEVAVPAVHFIESASGHNVPIFQVEQPGSEIVGIDFAQVLDQLGQVLDAYVALFLELLDRAGNWKVSREIENRCGRNFGVDDRFAIGHGTRQRVPAGRNVSANRVEAVLWRRTLTTC